MNEYVGGGVLGKYIEIEKIKPYIGIGYEYEMSGKVKATVEDLDIPESSFGGGTGIGEVGAIGKVWKLDVDVSV